MNPIKEDVGRRVKAIRENGGYSMEAFGKLINDSTKGTVNNWEKGKRIPKTDALEKIAILGNTTIDKILYGDLYEYVFNLVKQNLNLELNDKMIGMILLIASPHNLSYHDDVQWLEILQKIFAISEVEQIPVELFYIPISGSKNLYIGQVRNQKAIEQSLATDDFIPIYYIYADIETNTLHVIAFPLNEYKKELLFKGIDFITKKGGDYFIKNFDQIGLKLENFKIVSYGIHRSDLSENIKIYAYNEETKRFSVNPELEIEHFSFFENELAKEILQLKANNNN